MERRYALKAKELNALRKRIEKRIVLLEEKKQQFKSWAKKREEFISKADVALVSIYSKMRPDAAATRLEVVGEGLAASIIMKLSSRQAGVILNEMKPKRAAAITKIIAAFGQKGDAT
ncbi:MAG: MotE family protein [Rhizobiaceae bacterium]